MPISEYLLLALLGSGVISGGATKEQPLTADVMAQPNGGAMSASPQDPPKKEDGRNRRRSTARRTHKRGRHTTKHGSKPINRQ